MLFEDDAPAAGEAGGEATPFFAVLLLQLSERLGVTAGNGGNGDNDDGGCGLDGWIIRLDREVLLLTTPAGLWQVDTGAWASWDAPAVDWQLLPFAVAPEAFERVVAARGGEAIVTLTRPLLSLPDNREALATLLATYAPPKGTDAWSRNNRRLYDEVTAAVAALGAQPPGNA